MASTKTWIYRLLRWSNDANAVRKGRVGRRIVRRVAGKATGRWFGRWLG